LYTIKYSEAPEIDFLNIYIKTLTEEEKDNCEGVLNAHV
jgi:hypothetical protein